jgi:hypothetical protein
VAYTFDFIDCDGGIDHFQLGLFPSDGDAMRQARAALLASTTAVRVDVWRGDDRVGRLEGPSDRFRRPADEH